MDAAFTKTGEVAIDYGVPYSGIKGIQGISPDTANNRIGVCVPSIPAITFFDPTTLLFIGRLMLTGIVAQPNGYAFDPSRNGHWVTDNADNKIRLISQAGAVLATYTPTALQLVGLDQLDYDPVGDRLIFSSGGGTNASRGYMWAIDIPKMRITAAGRAAEAAAPEGICLSLDGTQVVFASDGEYHSLTPYVISAPNNVNQLLRYPAAALAVYHFARRELIGVNNRVIADIVAGTTTNDFSLYTNTVTATVTSRLFRFLAYSNDGQTYPIFWRLGANIFQGSVGPTPAYCDMPAQTVAGSAAFQIGLRKGGAPYNTGAFCDITIEPLRLS
jgi:DNA-binding beta-propeller fold protein YncE